MPDSRGAPAWRCAFAGRVAGLLVAPMLLGAVFGSQVAFAEPSDRQMSLLANNCIQCHAVSATGAPQLGRAEDWQEALTRGEDSMLVNVVQGIRGMPPLGYCSACSEADFRELIRVLAGLPVGDGVAR